MEVEGKLSFSLNKWIFNYNGIEYIVGQGSIPLRDSDNGATAIAVFISAKEAKIIGVL